MEDCRLVFTLPAVDAALERTAVFSIDASSTFDVFRLAAERPLDKKALSYATRPARLAKVATVRPVPGNDTLVHRFPCAARSLHVFEVACAEGATGAKSGVENKGCKSSKLFGKCIPASGSGSGSANPYASGSTSTGGRVGAGCG